MVTYVKGDKAMFRQRWVKGWRAALDATYAKTRNPKKAQNDFIDIKIILHYKRNTSVYLPSLRAAWVQQRPVLPVAPNTITFFILHRGTGLHK